MVKGAFVAACLATGSSLAETPKLSDVTPVLSESRGSTSAMSGWIEVANPNSVSVNAVTRRVSSPLGYVIEVSERPVLVKPGESVKVPFSMAVRTDGLYHVTVPVDLVTADGVTVASVEGSLDLMVRDGTYVVDTYENLFVRPLAREQDEDGKPVWVFPTDGSTPFPDGADITEFHWTPEQLAVNTDEMIKDSPGETGEEDTPTLPLPPPRDTSVRHGEEDDAKFTQRSVDERIARATELLPRLSKARTLGGGLATGMTAVGSFFFTGLDGQKHSGWGWRVYAQMVIGSIKVPIAKTNVQPNGAWSLSLPAVPTSFPIVITYEPRNVYFTLRNLAGAYYQFSSGAQHTPVSDKVLNEFTQVAKLANGDLVGLGDLYRMGMRFWEALKGKGEGIDPVKSTSLSVYFPNTTYDCGRPDKQPWSCAAGNEIWLLPRAASSVSTFSHELAHQLANKYWGGYLPDGSGKPHGWPDCVNTGVALSEGFADFMPVWAGLNRNQTPAAHGFVDIEHPETFGACTTRNANEAWVAATFWDLYDSVADGQDSIFYLHTGATPKLFLKNGTHDVMSEFLPYAMTLASPQHVVKVMNIFSQNHQ
ncbi:hypothetical protein DRW03_06150 [Corallococcus sp. H22C18031201]|nr:hypothetical protein DRW03_06150 [Corallococcus sp. H22C18031201]